MNADFYIGLGSEAVWLGSIDGWGYPEDLYSTLLDQDDQDGYTEATFREAVAALIAESRRSVAGRDGTSPDDGWPWRYSSSGDTAYTYTWQNGSIHVFEYGRLIALHYPNGARKSSVFPDASQWGYRPSEAVTAHQGPETL